MSNTTNNTTVTNNLPAGFLRRLTAVIALCFVLTVVALGLQLAALVTFPIRPLSWQFAETARRLNAAIKATLDATHEVVDSVR